MAKVFLGGTCNDSIWRESLIQLLNIDYVNPVVENWTPESQEEEQQQKELCKFCLYVVTPKMIGVYSIAEVVDDSNKRPEKTLFCYLPQDENTIFDESQLKSLKAVAKLVTKNGAQVFNNLFDCACYLNKMGRKH